MGALQTMQGVVGAAASVFDAFFDPTGSQTSLSTEMQSAARSCLGRLYASRPSETLEAVIDKSVEHGEIKVSDLS